MELLFSGLKIEIVFFKNWFYLGPFTVSIIKATLPKFKVH